MSSPLSDSQLKAWIESQPPAAEARALNCRATLERLDGDLELFRDLVGYFFADSGALLDRIAAAVATGDSAELHKAAHRIKGLLANFDARPACETARALETMGREARLEEAADHSGALRRQVAELAQILEAVREHQA